MSGPVRGTVYVHIASGERFLFVGYSAATAGVVLTRISDPVDTDFYVIAACGFASAFAAADDLLKVAELIGTMAPQDQAGRQPLVEFLGGPTLRPDLFSDEHLAVVFGLNDTAGGAS